MSQIKDKDKIPKFLFYATVGKKQKEKEKETTITFEVCEVDDCCDSLVTEVGNPTGWFPWSLVDGWFKICEMDGCSWKGLQSLRSISAHSCGTSNVPVPWNCSSAGKIVFFACCLRFSNNGFNSCGSKYHKVDLTLSLEGERRALLQYSSSHDRFFVCLFLNTP